MTRYINDQNKVVIVAESGTYGNWMSGTAGGVGSRWAGEVTLNTIAEAVSRLEDRYLGNASRSYGAMEDGAIDITGTLTLHPQDMYFLAHAVGSVAESTTGGENVVLVTEVNSNVQQNPFISGTATADIPFCFGLEDSKQAPGTGLNFIRHINGNVIDSVVLNINQGEKVSVDVNYVGQNITAKSGTTLTITKPSIRPYLWSDCTLQMFGIGANLGSTIDTSKSISFEVNNNITPPHYVNGSKVIAPPYLGNRDYTLTVTADLPSEIAKLAYETYYRGGSTFNSTLDLDNDVTAVGSQHTIIRMSGCELMNMDIPSDLEGVNEFTMEVRPKNVDMSIWDDATKIGSYNPY